MAIPLTVICWNIISYFMPDFPRIPITRAGGGVTYLHISRFIPNSYFFKLQVRIWQSASIAPHVCCPKEFPYTGISSFTLAPAVTVSTASISECLTR